MYWCIHFISYAGSVQAGNLRLLPLATVRGIIIIDRMDQIKYYRGIMTEPRGELMC